MKALSVVILFLTTVCLAAGQATKPNGSEAMKALNFLVGKWQGKVVYEPGYYHLQETLWTAHVYYNVGGSILIIDEKGSEIDNRNNTTVEVLVLVYWDSEAKEYPTRLYWSTKDGTGSVKATAYIQDNKLLLKTNNAVDRFTVGINEKGQWHEIGEISSDGGANWKRRFEMTLNRQD